MTVRCTKEPLGYLNDDDTRSEPWTKIGEEEFNTCSRYDFADPAIEALKPAPKPFQLSEEPGDNPKFTVTLLRAMSMMRLEQAEHQRRFMSKMIDEYIIALGLASNSKDAGEVRIEDALKAERQRASSRGPSTSPGCPTP